MANPPQPRSFDQTSRITARLRDLVRSYPKGLGLVKEFLQNADDAGATLLSVTYDHRQHPGQLHTEEQNVVLGPALLFSNDSVFTKSDLENIQHIDDGGKLREARSIGRFGQGVNTFYSVSDHPTLLTADWVIWFDPHHRAHGRQSNAWAWSVEDVTRVWPAWALTFVPAGFSLGSTRFDGTIFRLPVRSQQEARRSEIQEEAFTDKDFEAILEEARRAGPALLIFLRSVQSLRIDEISPDGTRRLRYELTTLNTSQVEAARAPIREEVNGKPLELLTRWRASTEPLPVAAYTHEFQVCSDGKIHRTAWAVVSGLFRGPDNSLLADAQALCERREKALPWAGAAVPLEGNATVGGVACFLPLPEATPWPIWLHGWFDVPSSREGITRQAGTGASGQHRVAWNQTLLRYGVGPAWAALVEQLRRDAETTIDPYQLWPRPSNAKDDHDRALVEGFYEDLGNRPVFRCVAPSGTVWRSLVGMGNKFWTLDDSWHQHLRDPLLANGHILVDPPLPAFAIQALQTTLHPAVVLTAELVRNSLRLLTNGADINCALSDAPRKALSRPDWITALARFCAQGKLHNLEGLPLALLADGRLHSFGRDMPLYLVNKGERLLLAGVAHRLLDSGFQSDIDLAGPVPALGIKKLDLGGLVACVRELLAAALPDETWLSHLFDHLEQLPPAEVQKHKEDLNELLLVPDHKGRRSRMGVIDTPLLTVGLSDPLRHALTRLDVPMVSGSKELVAFIQRFMSRHPGFIWALSPGVLVVALDLHAKQPRLQQDAFLDGAVVNPILDFLSPLDWLANNASCVEGLRKLPMLPTTDGSFVSAETQDVYVPGGFVPPSGLHVRQKLLDTGKDGRWARMFRALRVPERDGLTFVVRGLLPAFRDAPREVRTQTLRWLRDNLRSIRSGLLQEQRNSLALEVRKAAILPLVGGGLGEPRYTYRPEADDARKLLGSVAQVPDVASLGDDSAQWSGFFVDLGLLSTPLADHLLEAIRQCASEAGALGVSSVRERLTALREHMVRYWNELGNPKAHGSQEFANALATIAWLPVDKPTPEKVAVAGAWPDRLYKASELAAPRFLHLVASVRPVLSGSSLPPEMASALGLQTEVSLSEVLAHFDAVRTLGQSTSGDGVQRACKTAFVAFVQHIAELPEKERVGWERRLAGLRETPCLLLKGAWWRPRRVFLESLPFATTWCVSLLEDPDVAGRSQIAEGLGRLGVRSKPESQDWVEMLQEQQTLSEGRPISNDALAQIHAALQQLRVENRDWLMARTISIPTADHRLMPAQQTLLPDDSRLNRMHCLRPLPLVEAIEVSLDIASRAGARSLHKELCEELSEQPRPSQDTRMLEWAEQRTRRISSSQFYEAVRRLAWHEAVDQGSVDPGAAAHDPQLLLARRLTLRVVNTLKVTSRLRGTNEAVFEQQAASFWEQQAAILWLSHGGTRKMSDELARTLATECKLDALRLSRLLEVEPDQLANLLDEDDIPVIPVGEQASAPPVWIAPEHMIDAQAPTTAGQDEPATVRKPGEQDEDSATEVTWGEELPSDDSPPPADERRGPRKSWKQGAGGRYQGQDNSGGRPHPLPGSWDDTAPDTALGEPDPLSPSEVPTRPGFGSSRPWSPDEPWSGNGSTRRLRSYPHREDQHDYDTSSTNTDEAYLVQQAAMHKVIDWEQKQGRVAQLVGSHRSSSIGSTGPQGPRNIVVKGIDGPWTSRGVSVTASEFQDAIEQRRTWWLYVVEHAREPSRAEIHARCNPFLEATEHRFDSGWRALTKKEEAQTADPVEGAEIVLEDGRAAMVIEAERRGRLWRVKLQFSDGHEELRSWSPAWMRG